MNLDDLSRQVRVIFNRIGLFQSTASNQMKLDPYNPWTEVLCPLTVILIVARKHLSLDAKWNVGATSRGFSTYASPYIPNGSRQGHTITN